MALQGRALERIHLANETFPRDLHDGAAERYSSVKRRGGSNEAVSADHCGLDHLSVDKATTSETIALVGKYTVPI